MQTLIAMVMLSLLFATSAMAYGYGKAAPVPYPTPKGGSKLGNVTGGDCSSNEECWQACVSKAGDEEKTITCLNTTEGSSNCGDAKPGPGGLACECLPDAKHCGYAFPHNR